MEILDLSLCDCEMSECLVCGVGILEYGNFVYFCCVFDNM